MPHVARAVAASGTTLQTSADVSTGPLAVWIRILGASWRTTILVAVVATVLIHLAFYKLLRVPLPWGVLERWAF